MFCSQCGKEVNENAKFCSNCGAAVAAPVAPVVETPGPEAVVAPQVETQEPPAMGPLDKPKKNSKVGLIIGIIVLLLVLIVAGAAMLLFMNRPVDKVVSSIQEGNVAEAVAMYDKVTSEQDAEKVIAAATAYAISLKDNYIAEAEGITYDSVCKSLDALDTGITEGDEGLANVRAIVDMYKTSRDHFVEAQKQETAGNYVDALNLYAAVLESDKGYYDKAQSAKETVCVTVRTEAIDAMNRLADAGDFEGAQKELDNALAILKNDAELLAQQQVLVQKQVDNYVSKAEAAISEQRYTDAMAIINDAMVAFPDNASIAEVKNSIPEEAYLIGNWELTCDITEVLAAYDEEYAGVDVALSMTMIMSFREDGTYYFAVDEESFKDAFAQFTLEYVYQTFEAMNISREEADGYVESGYGCTLEEYVYALCEEEFADMNSEFSQEGTYTVTGNKLYMNGSFNYETYTVQGNTLTIDLPGDNSGSEIFPGLSYPMVFQRSTGLTGVQGNL